MNANYSYNRGWSEKDLAKVARLFKEGLPVKYIAQRFGKSQTSIHTVLKKIKGELK